MEPMEIARHVNKITKITVLWLAVPIVMVFAAADKDIDDIKRRAKKAKTFFMVYIFY